MLMPMFDVSRFASSGVASEDLAGSATKWLRLALNRSVFEVTHDKILLYFRPQTTYDLYALSVRVIRP